MSDTESPRQTLSYLQRLLASRRIEPKNKLGQNFLIDLNLLDLIVQSADLSTDDLVLEVGTGTGSLTGKLLEGAGAVVSVEIDQDFHTLAREILGERPNLRLLWMDILARKNELNPGVLATLEEVSKAAGCTRFKLIANLPYVVATPVISNFLMSKLSIDRMVVTVQWEIAERLTASPGIECYGALSVLTQSLADVSIVRRLGPMVFWPKPKVDSAIVLIRPNEEKRARVKDVVRFRHFLRDLYTQRRKNLRQALSGWPGGHREKSDVDETLAQLGIDGKSRAETLSIDDHLRLCNAFAEEETS